ncbi:universal stress protein family domain protein [Apiospora arundinis]|uniref:Universal stress protein family n=1 Tax=Apiospora arundinis TaxID=335852 RepID=A0ABR2HMW6_9PEZI
MSKNTTPVQSPASDVSPRSQPTPKRKDYFDNAGQTQKSSSPPSRHDSNSESRAEVKDDTSASSISTPGNETVPSPGAETAPSPGSSGPLSRKPSVSSVSFRPPKNPQLPQGTKKPHTGNRRRAASPPHRRFQHHVAFDNIDSDYTPKKGTISFTLNAKHDGYHRTRSSRTFMVGVDDNYYSDHALQWLLDELVDDGDEIVCVRVFEIQGQSSDKLYRDAANALMQHIQSKNVRNLAIKLVVEYAVGKLHSTFQSFISIHEPSMLIVGTKGRSLDTVQGFFSSYNSFSKYCLQYSPVPVVVVRPNEKREKKKAKRAQDPSRHSYLSILAGQPHEADSDNNSTYELEPTIAPDEEAHRVAMAVGLPAAFDPTIKPLDVDAILARGGGKRAATPISDLPLMVNAAAKPEGPLRTVNKEAGNNPSPESDGDDSEYEEEFEVSTGEEALKKERLHKMESNEGAALKVMQSRKMSTESIDDEDEGGAKTGNG